MKRYGVAAAVAVLLAGCGSSPTATGQRYAPGTPEAAVEAILGAASCAQFAEYITNDSKPLMVGCTTASIREPRAGHSFHINFTRYWQGGASVQLSDDTSISTADLRRQDGRWRISLRGILAPDNPWAAFPWQMAPWIRPVCTSRHEGPGIVTSCQYPYKPSSTATGAGG